MFFTPLRVALSHCHDCTVHCIGSCDCVHYLDGGDTELRADTLTGQSGHNFLFVDVLWQIMRDELECVCVCVGIYETLHSSFSSSVATWVVVCLIQASPASPLPADSTAAQYTGYGGRLINTDILTNHPPPVLIWSESESNSDLEKRIQLASCNKHLYVLCHSLIETNTFVNKYQKKGVS